MENVHGIDVSWMTHGNPKDKANKNGGSGGGRRSSLSTQNREPPPPPPVVASTNSKGNSTLSTSSNTPKTPSPSRPGFIRSNSADKAGQNNVLLQRRTSWFSNISSKFSSSSPSQQSPQQAEALPPSSQSPPIPKITPARNAVLQHAAKVDGDGPYTPAPPRNAGFLGVFRRLSSTSGSAPASSVKGNHGLVDRVVLNVDHHRERCKIKELNQAKLRRVAFCVDVEIAPMPKYGGLTASKKVDMTQKRKLVEKGEAEALKNPDAVVEDQKETDGAIEAAGESVPNEPQDECSAVVANEIPQKCAPAVVPEVPPKDSSTKKKKEKKKKSEEERKARKEKKRQLAEANGSIPMEIHRNSTDSSSSGSPTASAPMKTQAYPTTNPVRIYRRCCQLRESPILKKITEQLSNASNSIEPGVVEKLDLTGYFMDLPDLVTIGDYFAVVPIKEVILEGCGMTDEGLRVVLAGLLAAKKAECKRRRVSTPDGLAPQGGVVERLVIKNNKIGPEGWRHISLFIYMCRSLKHLDVSGIRFPKPVQRPETPLTTTNGGRKVPMGCAYLFSRAIGNRLAGSELELLNIGETDLKSEQLDIIMDGIIKCGIRRLGLANNNIDSQGLEHIARYLREGRCEGLDLGGNDLRETLDVLGDALSEDHMLWALSLADCNLNPPSLCKLFPKLVKLPNVRFLDLSHNRDLFHWDPSAVGLLRRYLPKMACLKRIHLADVAMTPEQAIQIIEILPEVPHLAHISLLENPRLVSLADAKSEESQEEACALYASLLAATRVSHTIVCVDIDVPRDSSGEVVKALARQVVAYCLRNMERIQVPDLGVSTTSLQDGNQPETQSQSGSSHNANSVPDVLLNLVGHDVEGTSEESEGEVAPDEDYVIGGTGVVKALAVCLKNRGDESRRQSGEFIHEVETGTMAPRARLPPGKAKDMSKHLLLSARKIRVRLQPALAKAKLNKTDRQTYQRLQFLDHTLDGMINRFEDEFPDTKESATNPDADAGILSSSSPTTPTAEISEVPQITPDEPGILSEDDETDIRSRSRSNSMMSNTSKALVEEEGRTLRTGHKFRRGFLKQEHYEVLGALEGLKEDPNHVRMLTEMMEELNDDYLTERAMEVGVVEMFKMEKEKIFQLLRDVDPSHWDRFIESQEKAMRNVAPGNVAAVRVGETVVDENALED